MPGVSVSRYAASVALGGAILALCTPAQSAARPTPAQRLATVQRDVSALSAARFASTTAKARVTRLARRATRAAARRGACRALARTEALRVVLKQRRTWHGGRRPRALVRRLDRRIAPAARALLRRAGPRCAKAAKRKRIKAQPGEGPYEPLPRPDELHEQGEEDELELERGHFRPLETPGAQSGLGLDPRAPAALPGGAAGAAGHLLQAPSGPSRFFRVADLGSPSTFPGSGVQEPTAALGGDVVWFSGNSQVAYSVDRGRSFTFLNVSTVLPDNGLPFCCDQIVEYSPQQNLFIWLTQYWCSQGTSNPATSDCRGGGTGSNRLRVSVASPQAIKANTANMSRAWTSWDLPPSLFGQPSGTWFDHNEMAANRSSVTLTSNPVRGTANGSLIARLSLADLQRRGTIGVSYIFDGLAGNLKPAHGVDATTTYIPGAETWSRTRVWSWAANSGTLFLHQLDHTTTPIFNAGVNGTNAADWYDRYGIFPGQMDSATVSGDDLWTAIGTGRAYCTSGCGPGQTQVLDPVFAQPAVQVHTIDTRSWRISRERWLWNPGLAFGFPALATSRSGQVGITFLYSEPGANPLPVAGWLTNGEEFTAALPSSGAFEAGDYYGLRPGSTATSFGLGAYSVQRDADAIQRFHWHYIEYFRGEPPQFRPPSVVIQSPLNGRVFIQGQSITYTALVSDPQDGRLPADAIVWREDGVVIGRGPTITRSGTPFGQHAIEVTATNSEGLSTSARIAIRVDPASAHAPVVAITSPADNQQFLVDGQDPTTQEYYKDVQFLAQASDPDGDLLTYRWTDSVNGAPPAVVSTQLSPLLRLRLPAGQLNATHDLVLEVSDGTSTTAAPIRVRVYIPG